MSAATPAIAAALGVLGLVVAVGDLLVDVLLLAARVGELLGVLERAVERFAGSLSFEDRCSVFGAEALRALAERGARGARAGG